MMDGVLVRRETDTEEKPRGNGGRDRRGPATSPGMPRNFEENHQKPEEREAWDGFSPRS